MVETRGLEAVAKLLVEPLIVPENDAGDDRASLPCEPRRHRPRYETAEAIRQSGHSSPATHYSKGRCVQDDMDTLAAQVRSLVE